MERFTATIEFMAVDRESAEMTFMLMRETFINDERIQEIFATLTRGVIHKEPVRMITSDTNQAC